MSSEGRITDGWEKGFFLTVMYAKKCAHWGEGRKRMQNPFKTSFHPATLNLTGFHSDIFMLIFNRRSKKDSP